MESNHKGNDTNQPKSPIPKDAVADHQEPDAASASTYQEATGSIWRDCLHADTSSSTR